MAQPIDIDAAYRRHGPMVFRRCVQLLRDEAKAEDALQDVFTQLAAHQSRLDWRAPVSLLNRIATNVCLNRLRQERVRSESPETEALLRTAHHDDTEERTLAGRVLNRLFRSERESTRVMAVLHLVDGLTHEEVAREVGLSVAGVRKRLTTFKSRLAVEERS